MSFEPEKFFIGIVDFFSIVMPGALLAYAGKDWAATELVGAPSFPLGGAESWMVFLFASYLLGHFAFLAGSTLDDLLYDSLRKLTYFGQINRLAVGERLSSRRWRAFASSRWVFGRNPDAAVMKAQQIKARTLQTISSENAINAFQWSKARLSKEHPAGLLAVQRFEADSKFFRSFVVVLLVLAAMAFIQRRPGLGAVCLAFLVPALWRYADQRFKATQHAYWFVLTLEADKAAGKPATSPTAEALTHAGGVVFRMQGGAAEYLLVRATHDRAQWVLPKGHIEPGETPPVTAVREVKEETGHWARVVKWIDDVPLKDGDTSSLVRFFLMTLESEGGTNGDAVLAESRDASWLALDAAKRQATFEETHDLLERAASLRTAPPE